jgi:hypothetical protein
MLDLFKFMGSLNSKKKVKLRLETRKEFLVKTGGTLECTSHSED